MKSRHSVREHYGGHCGLVHNEASQNRLNFITMYSCCGSMTTGFKPHTSLPNHILLSPVAAKKPLKYFFKKGGVKSIPISRETSRSSYVSLIRNYHSIDSNTAVQEKSFTSNADYFSQLSPFSNEISLAVHSLQSEFASIDRLVAFNLNRLINAFSNARVGPQHFSGTTGYGHSDSGGRSALDSVFAEITGSEMAIVRSQIFSGTHAIACALYGVLRPGDELLSVVGSPYDTLEEVIGIRKKKSEPSNINNGSLADFGVTYREIALTKNGGVNWNSLQNCVREKTKCVFIQRSCGYALRESLSINDIQRIVEIIKSQNSECIILVDNCYGEFVDTLEPTAVGADLIAGSLIKNPGGTIAPCGGYIAGKEKYRDAICARLTAPGIGSDSGATPGEIMRLLFQGLFLSPQMVGEALKSSLLIAEVMSNEGFKVHPNPRVHRKDIIQAVEFGSREKLITFCQLVQKNCPVGSYIRPVAASTPGYESEVIFADGTFIDGSTIELSCDGPLREPYAVFCQGGTHWSHWALVLDSVIQEFRRMKS